MTVADEGACKNNIVDLVADVDVGDETNSQIFENSSFLQVG